MTNDLSNIIGEADAVCARTDTVCTSTSLPEYRAHMNALEDTRDALTSLENSIKREVDALKNNALEVHRWIKKVEDHWERSKAQSNDVRFNRPADPSPPKQ